jgi:hypothetical protein
MTPTAPSAPSARATIVVDKHVPAQSALVEAWLAAWAGRLAFKSENYGCGCCVDAWDVEGPPAAIAEIPAAIRADSEWAREPQG